MLRNNDEGIPVVGKHIPQQNASNLLVFNLLAFNFALHISSRRIMIKYKIAML